MKIQIGISALFIGLIFASCGAQEQETASEPSNLKPDENGKVILSNEKWEEILPEATYQVMRENGTERPYTGKLLNNHEKGIFACRACGLPLFSSETKFESNTGWPSFYQVIDRKNVKEEAEDDGRTEVSCARCDGHIGHVFNDGPKPTGLRYCMNSVALQFEKK